MSRRPGWIFGFLFAASVAHAQEGKPRADHVIVISIDGLRPDAIQKAPASTLLALIRQGAYCAKAQTIVPSITLPSHASMLTGLDYARHGVTHNDYKPGSVEHPTILSIAKESGRTTAMFFAKDKFHYLVRPDSVDYLYGDEPGRDTCETSAGGIGKAFGQAWAEKKYALTFVHIKEPDSAGHGAGWMSEAYLEAVRKADEGVAAIVEAVRKSGRWEKTAILVTSDHGGSGRGHGDDTPENRTIPWICVGPRVKRGLALARAIRTYDTAATALAFLGLAIPKGIDGKPVTEVLR